MTHQPLTKAERDNVLSASSADGYYAHDIRRLCADLDAAEAKIYGLKSRICGLDCRYTMGDVADISGSHCTQPCERCLADRDRMEAEAQRERAESELDAERRMRAEAEAAAKRAEEERDALKAQRDSLHARLYPQPCKGCPGCSSYADCPDEIDRLTKERDRAVLERAESIAEVRKQFSDVKAERDALKAQLDEREGDMHARIRAGYDATVADSWRAKVAEIEMERDALKAKLAALLQTATDLREVAFDGPSEPKGTGCPESYWDWRQRIDRESAAAIAAARGGAAQ